MDKIPACEKGSVMSPPSYIRSGVMNGHSEPRNSAMRTCRRTLLYAALLATLITGETFAADQRPKPRDQTSRSASGSQVLPETVIRSRPPAEISSCSVRLTISSTVSVWGYETKLDDGPWTLGPQFTVKRTGSSLSVHGLVQQGGTARTSTVVPHTVTGLSSGEHKLLVRTFDGTGQRDLTPEEVSWTVSPVETIITGHPDAWVTPHTSISFQVQSSSAKWAFEYRVDGGEWRLGSTYSLGTKPAPGVAYKHSEVTRHTDHTRHEKQIIPAGGEGGHTLDVRAFNDCGEVGPVVTSKWKTSWVHTTMLRPPPVGTVSRADIDFVVEVGPTRPTFEYAVDGGEWQRPTAKPQPSSATMGVQVHVNDLSEGTHSLLVRSVDQQGRKDTDPIFHQWDVDTTPPKTYVKLNSVPGQGPSEASFQWSCDNSAGCTYRYRLDAEDWVETERLFLRVGGLSPGSHTLIVAAVDAAGNTDPEPATYEWDVDFGPPITTIAVGPNKYTPERTAHFEFFTSKDGCRIFYSLDGSDFVDTGGHSLGLYDLSDGTHRLRVYSSDSFGRVEPSPGVYTWVVDTVPPSTVLHQWFLSPTEPGVAVLSVGVSAAGSDAAAELIFDYQYQICSSATCSAWHLGPKTSRLGSGYELRIAGLNNGTNHVAIRASDRAGNTDPSPVLVDIHYHELPSIDANGVRGVQSRTHSRSLQQDFETEDSLEFVDTPATREVVKKTSWIGYLLSFVSDGGSTPTPHSELRRRMRREL